MAASAWSWRLAPVVIVLAACVLAPALHAAGVPKPFIQPARGGKCIAPPAVMLRDHMKMLKHQRELTVREGMRGAKVNLQACVNCHASRADDSVAARPQDFCISCHTYVGVKVDCFECHSPKPGHPLHATFAPAAHTITATAPGSWLQRLTRQANAKALTAMQLMRFAR